MPAPHSGEDYELFIFSGICVFDNTLRGIGPDWQEGPVEIFADYKNVISQDQAILLRHWTVDVHLASILNLKVANNTGWSVNAFSLKLEPNNPGGGRVAVSRGSLGVKATVAARDVDAFVLRLSYHVTILGKVVEFQGGPID